MSLSISKTKSPAWHRRDRRKRGQCRLLLQVAKARLCLHGHHGSAVPLAANGVSTSSSLSPRVMSGAPWTCRGCGTHNGGHRRKCTLATCRMLAPSTNGDVQGQKQDRADRRGMWPCVACNFFNYASRVVCHRCSKPPTGQSSSSAAGGPSQPVAAAPKAATFQAIHTAAEAARAQQSTMAAAPKAATFQAIHTAAEAVRTQ